MSTFGRMTEFTRYLGLPLSLMQVSEIVGVEPYRRADVALD
ncbi:DUF746 domain-containing protein [Paraburkholderia sp. J12]|nr:hypothetical protein [Paraburkholderia sp. J12]